ncbi:hypothetical protein [Halomicronema hongdechloris]|nr:hypothetical protein [Halomicronema hongdechloris]
MDTASQYWHLIRLTGAGDGHSHMVPQVKTWLQPWLADDIKDAETTLQQRLITIWQANHGQADLAQLSLRCFISHQIRDVCLQLAQRFGPTHGFSARDLFPLVLDDDGQLQPNHRPFTLEILDTYDPTQANLGAWARRLTQHHRDLNQALLEQGLYRASDWAILNDTSVKQLQRILQDYHHCSDHEISRASRLLQQYHQVYRRDRIRNRQGSANTRCQPPSREQLQRIEPAMAPRSLLHRLKTLASQLRAYRIHVRSGHPIPYSDAAVDWTQVADPRQSCPNDDDQAAFLAAYRQALEQDLDAAIADSITTAITQLRQRRPPKDDPYVEGLYLFHCQGMAMGQLAPRLGLSGQVQVNRLLQLKRLRAEVRHRLIPSLCQTVYQAAQPYVSAAQLQQLNQTLEQLLTQEVDQLLDEARSEAQIPKDRTAQSLFARRLCHVIHRFLSSPETALE